jgi:HlyD family secretion protein
MKRAIVALAIIGVIGAGAGAYYIKNKNTDLTVNTAPITRGEIIDTVAATGTLQAVTTVQVGSQVSGNISWLGADFNSIVHKGQVIARLDPALFQAAVAQARANLAKSQADVEHDQVAVTDAQQKYTRAKELAARNLLPQSDLDAAKIALDSAQAMLVSSQATVKQAQANLNQAEVNLEHTVITAPIDGIVIQRSVDVGQTVAASMQAPTLFIIAADLTKMQVNANIDEADVGRIRPGQTVTFHVDAYPTEEFQGTVEQIRLQPVVVQNVTTYGTIIDVPNDDLKLKPGMTANLKVQIARRSDVLRVPNAALRFRPSADVFAALNQAVPPEAQYAGGRGSGGAGGRGGFGATGGAGGRGFNASAGAAQTAPGSAPARGQGTSAAAQQPAKVPGNPKPAAPSSSKSVKGQSAETIDALFAPLQPVESRGRVWLFMNRQLKPVTLRLGITDGTNTELLSGELQPGMEVVTGVVLGGSRTTSANPSNPLLPGRGGPGGFGGRGR